MYTAGYVHLPYIPGEAIPGIYHPGGYTRHIPLRRLLITAFTHSEKLLITAFTHPERL